MKILWQRLRQSALLILTTLSQIQTYKHLSLEGLQQSTLVAGGIPWYVEPFDPDGTILHEERWTGPEVLREMSEELSDIDDDELEGLAALDSDVDKQDMTATTTPSAPVARGPNTKKNGKARRRWRGFKR